MSLAFSFPISMDFYTKCIWFLSNMSLKNNCTQANPQAHNIWYFSFRMSLRLLLVLIWQKNKKNTFQFSIASMEVWNYIKLPDTLKFLWKTTLISFISLNWLEYMKRMQKATCHHGFRHYVSTLRKTQAPLLQNQKWH